MSKSNNVVANQKAVKEFPTWYQAVWYSMYVLRNWGNVTVIQSNGKYILVNKYEDLK